MIMEMDRDKAFKTISKHIFYAYRCYSTEFDPIIILANDMDEAKDKATKYFTTSFITVKQVHETDDVQIYDLP